LIVESIRVNVLLPELIEAVTAGTVQPSRRKESFPPAEVILTSPQTVVSADTQAV
jgi:ERCC4-related helicase